MDVDGTIAGAAVARGREVGWSRGAAGLLVAGLSGLMLFLAWRSLGWPLIHDAPLMHYVAWRMGQGAVPYRDLFDMNFPGVYLLHRGVLRLFGPADLGFRLFDLSWLGATCALIALCCRRFGIWSAATAALLFGAYHLAGGAWRAGQRDFLLVLFLVAGVHFVARFWEDGQSLAPLAAGLAVGGGLTIKPHAGLFGLALVLAVAQGARRRGQRWGPAAAAVVGGGLLPPAAVALWLWEAGGLAAFADLLTGYVLPVYSRLGRVSVLDSLAWPAYGWEVLVLAGGLAALSLWRARVGGQLDIRQVLLLVGIGYGVVHYWVQGKGWEYQLYPLMGFALPLAASWVDRLQSERERGGGVRAAMVVGLLVLTGALGVKGVDALEPEWIVKKERRVESLVAALRGRVQPAAGVQVLDTTEGGIHALLRLEISQPTRFLYDFTVFRRVEHPYVQKLRREFLQALRRRPPGFFVIFEHGWPGGGYERLSGFPELAAWIQAGYLLDGEGDGYRIYARRRDR